MLWEHVSVSIYLIQSSKSSLNVDSASIEIFCEQRRSIVAASGLENLTSGRRLLRKKGGGVHEKPSALTATWLKPLSPATPLAPSRVRAPLGAEFRHPCPGAPARWYSDKSS